jgi:hypothetical protein
VVKLLLLLLLVELVKKLLFLLQHVFLLAEKATLCLLSFLMLLVKRLSET